MKEFEWFEWFGPSPIEPFNPGKFPKLAFSAGACVLFILGLGARRMFRPAKKAVKVEKGGTATMLIPELDKTPLKFEEIKIYKVKGELGRK